MNEVLLHHGDCLDILPQIPSQSVDAVITDPPYPHIKRDYGYWTTEEWWALVVEGVIPEVRRILKPSGSAVFILQPNSEKVGKMRGWLWEFMAWVCREWNMVQDVWWWNYTKMPTGGANKKGGLARESIKACVWAGDPRCYRNQSAVYWEPAQSTIAENANNRWYNLHSGRTMNRAKIRQIILDNGGVTPFNLLPMPVANSVSGAGAHGHGAGTPLKLADWWTRYICPPDGVILDPFMGSGTMGLAALQNGCGFIGIEKMGGKGYFETAEQRINEELQKARQLEIGI